MPQYSYATETGVEFTAFQRMADAPLTHHPETGEPCRRLPPRGVNAIDWTDAGAKTAGQQAERNMRRLGSARVAALHESRDPTPKRPAYLPGSGPPPDVFKIINSPEKANHYIRTGEVK